ncbi:MAG: TonB-dependent receptor plug domain-containing protein [Alphaproteobacteria bacterium]|nr:TonB-dependent receptor plug domain-containing protein [Alphaproteobacteria bacterium]
MVFSNKSIIALSVATLMSTTALAQQTMSDDNSSTVVYEESYFTQFKPITLHDMLRSVPGTAALLAQADEELTGRRVRGFGSDGDQILIDGKRIAGKANSLGLQLKRIQASQVSHIELIRGTKAGLDVQSEGLIINVVLKENASRSNTVWTAGGAYAEGGSVDPLAKVTHTGESGNLKYLFGADFAFEETRQNFADTIYNNVGALAQNNALTSNKDRKKLFLNSNLEYNAENGDIFRLNGQLEFDGDDTLETDHQNLVLANNTRLVVRDREHNPFHWEFGGDYQHRFEDLGLLKTLFVINHGKHDWDTLFQGALNGAALATTSSNYSQRTHGEKILRSSLTNTFAEKHTIEVGGEVAINDVGTKNTSRNAAGVINPNTVSDISVQEVRFQAFGSHNYTFAPNVSLQSSLNAEWSEITQKDNINAANPDFSRNFFYLKPRMNLRYDVDEQNQIRVTVERKISQLDFGDFGNSFDVEDNEVDAGNPLLRPEDTWEFSIAYENRFADDQGSISVKGFYNKIRDHIAKIGKPDPIANPTNDYQMAVLSLPGNIGNAKEYGVEFNGSWRLKAIELPNAIISGKYILRESDVLDPFTLLNRPIEYKQKHEWLVTFQHDIVEMGTSYGFNITNKAPMNGIGYRTDVIEHWEKTVNPKASLYIEQKVFGDMKLRFDLKNILKAKNGYHLTKYVGNISNGVVDYNEIRKASMQRVYQLTLQGTF